MQLVVRQTEKWEQQGLLSRKAELLCVQQQLMLALQELEMMLQVLVQLLNTADMKFVECMQQSLCSEAKLQGIIAVLPLGAVKPGAAENGAAAAG